VNEVGERLNIVNGRTECPRCGQVEDMAVHELAVVWQCGWTRPLPPLPNQKMRPWQVRRE
jgi:ribosomal protein S27AE